MYINNLITGSLTLGSGGSAPVARTATRVWYGDDENVYTDYEISGSISGNNYTPTSQIPNVKSAKKIEIGSDVTSIGDYAFYECSGLTSVTISDGVTSIGTYAFSSCENLTNIIISENVISIEETTFYGCGCAPTVSNEIHITFEGKSKSTVQGMTNYPFALNQSSWYGAIVSCTDGDIEIPCDM